MSENLPAVAGTSDVVFRLMDTLDDKQIIEQLEGRLPEVLTYHFKDGKSEVWGLSKNGVDECRSEMAKKGEVIRELECECIDQGDEAFFKCRAGRYLLNSEGKEVPLDVAFGFKRQAKKTPRGGYNSFWYEQGSIKSCRNAVSRLIPSAIKEAVIAYAKGSGKVKEIEAEEVKEIAPEKPTQARADLPASEAQTRTIEKLLSDFGVELVTVTNDMESDGVAHFGNRVITIDSLNRDEAQRIIEFIKGG